MENIHKHHGKMQRRLHKSTHDLSMKRKELPPIAVVQQGLKQDRAIEEILSPFWAWRAVL